MNEKNLEILRKLFFDTSNRPKKTPLHTTSIYRILEDQFPEWKINDMLKKLVEKKILRKRIEKTQNVGNVHFYFSTKLTINAEFNKKFINISKHIDRYSRRKITKIIGDHLHDLVRKELKTNGFDILNEYNAKSYKNKKWSGRESLDIIAEHAKKNIPIGVEIKNRLEPIDPKVVSTKIRICKSLGVKPIFACRWFDGTKKIIEKEGGFPWEFKIQMYPRGYEKFTEELRKKFHYPVYVTSELSENSIKDFQEWLN